MLPGGEKEKKASTKRKRGREEDASSRLRPSKIQCTPPPRIQPGRELLSGHQAMGGGGGGGGGGAYKTNGKINKYYYGRGEASSNCSGKANKFELRAASTAGAAAAKGSIVVDSSLRPE